MDRPQSCLCRNCGVSWIGSPTRCPNGCAVVAKSLGEFTKKTLQGDDADLMKSGR